jgi:hypothetical protein
MSFGMIFESIKKIGEKDKFENCGIWSRDVEIKLNGKVVCGNEWTLIISWIDVELMIVLFCHWLSIFWINFWTRNDILWFLIKSIKKFKFEIFDRRFKINNGMCKSFKFWNCSIFWKINWMLDRYREWFSKKPTIFWGGVRFYANNFERNNYVSVKYSFSEHKKSVTSSPSEKIPIKCFSKDFIWKRDQIQSRIQKLHKFYFLR